MINLAVVYLLVSIALVAVAIFVHVHSTSLSLPVSPVASVLVILLPIGAFFNALFHSRILRSTSASPNSLTQIAPFIIQTLQGLVTTILATLFTEGFASSQALDCKLDTAWMSMFRAHDAAGIRGIQDAFNCCGLNSVKDRAYPFPGMGASTCAETYGRTLPCRGPWKSATQATSGAEVAVAVVVGLMQIINLLVAKWTASRWRFAQNHQQEQPGNENRRLIGGSGEDVESPRQQDNGLRSYGAVNGDGPRVEPSPINESNQWDSE
ncbi:hypothetical protein G7Z17_g7985 [Cylindrodendrum hubeiense]|uniref:Tetraspanin n=1 Tax=Cylindrodendrum hubeiense TaxID=595255 RepID=A0A9P5LDN1_9HYPO|nr:hypothetical protein G7Z17_g7985 [Cylindrodendrum hubeiense]